MLTISFQKLAPKSRALPTSFWRPAQLCNCLAECFWVRKVRTTTTRRTRWSTGSTITGFSTRNSNRGRGRGRGSRPASSSINSRCRVGFRYKLVSMFEWPWLIIFEDINHSLVNLYWRNLRWLWFSTLIDLYWCFFQR